MTGKRQFEQCVLLTQKQPLDLTVYPCYNANHHGATYPNLVLPAGAQTLRINIVLHSNHAIPPGIPSPTELYLVASVNSPALNTQALPTQLLANTKMLLCKGLTPQIDSPVGVQTLHISHSQTGASLPFRDILQNCPQLEELHLENSLYSQMSDSTSPFTHQQLHTISLKGITLPSVICAFEVGCRFPRLSRLVLTNINGLHPAWYHQRPCTSNDLLSQFTHIEVSGLSGPHGVAHLRLLFDASMALHTLTLVGAVVGPVLALLVWPAPKRVKELRSHNSDANGAILQSYLTTIQ